jgi:hypothetical protein
MEIMVWKTKTKSGDDKITSFEHHMRLHQQRRDMSGAKKENSNAVNLKNPDYCAWCFKNTGKKWNNHTEATYKDSLHDDKNFVKARPHTSLLFV